MEAMLPILLLISYTLFGPLNIIGVNAFAILLPGAAVAIFFRALSPGSRLRVNPSFVKLTVLYGIFLISLLISSYQALPDDKSFLLFRNYAANLILVLVISLAIRSENYLKTVTWVLLLITAIGGLLGLLQTFVDYRIAIPLLVSGDLWADAFAWRPVGYGYMPYRFGNDMLVGFLPGLALYLHANQWATKPAKRWLIVLVIISFLGLVLSRSRSSWLGGSVGMIYVLWRSGIKKPTLKWITLALIAIAILLGISPARDRLLDRLTMSDYNTFARLRLARAGWDMFIDAPVFGHGLGSFPILAPYYLPTSVRETYPHNVFLGLLVECGLVGLLLYVSTLSYAFGILGGSLSSGVQSVFLRSLGMGLQADLIGYSVDSLFHNYFFDNHLWFLVALSLSTARIANASRHSTRSPIPGSLDACMRVPERSRPTTNVR